MLLLRTILALFFSTASVALHAFDYRPSEDLSRIRVFLQTYDEGDMVYSNFGHNALRIVDGNKADLVFNWGIFDFRDPLTFSYNFYQNIMPYSLGIFPFATSLAEYKHYRRAVWEDEINLSDDEKRVLLDLLAWNSKPENRGYQYRYFEDNCSTRIRDYLDKAWNGKLSAITKSQAFGQTYRDLIERAYAPNPFVGMSLDLMMNSNIDRHLSVWDSMFLPLQARSTLLALNGGGEFILGSRLLLDFPKPKASPLSGYGWVRLYVLSLCALALGFYAFDAASRRAGTIPTIVFRILGLAGLPIVLYAGLAGMLMPINWMFSSHADLHHNANMLLFLPFDFLFIPVFATWLIKGRPTAAGFQGIRRKLLLLHMVCTLGVIVAWILGFIEQDLKRAILGMHVVYLILLGSILWLDKESSSGTQARGL